MSLPAQAQLRVSGSAGVTVVPSGTGAAGQSLQSGNAGLSPASFVLGASGQASLSPALTQVPSLDAKASIVSPQAKAMGVSALPRGVHASLVQASRISAASPKASIAVEPGLSRQDLVRRTGVSAPKVVKGVAVGRGAEKTRSQGRVQAAFSWGRSVFDGSRRVSSSDDAGPVAGTNSVSKGPRLSRAQRRQVRAERKAAIEAEMREAGLPEPSKLPLWKRALVLTGVFGGLAAAPALLSAEVLPTVVQAVASSLGGSPLQIFAMNSELMLNPLAWAAAAAIAYVTTPLRFFVYRMSPWSMRVKEDDGENLFKQSPWLVVPKLALGAALEEWLFRGMIFGLGFIFAATVMPAPLTFVAASFGGSFIFSIIHGYGPVWTRVVGGMLYSGLFALTGSLLFAALTHFFFNLGLYIRYLRERRGA